jgi:hypothetical protein
LGPSDGKDTAVTNDNPEAEDEDSSIAILLADLPALLATLIRQVIDVQGSMWVIGEVFGPVELLVSAARADVVVLGVPQAEPLPPICTHLLTEYPHLCILALSISTSEAVGYRLTLHHHRLQGGSADEILHSISTLYRLDALA